YDLVDSLAALGRYEQQRRIWDEVELIAYMAGEGSECVVVLGDQIPLIDDNRHAFELLPDHAGDLRVLGGPTFFRIDQQQRHIGALDRAHGPQHAVLLDPALDFAAPADAGGIDQ